MNKKHYKDSKLVSDLFKTFLHNRIRPANNRAKEQQDAEQLQRYLLSTQINLSKEEVDKILRKYKRIR